MLLGIPLDHNSSYLRGPAQAPPLIRAALHCDAWNHWTESGVNLDEKEIFADAGDLPELEAADAFLRIEEHVARIIDAGNRPLCLGGDHSITYPILCAVAKRVSNSTLIHFDAHPDLYENYENNPRSHASPFARICEDRLVKRVIQIGIRTLNPHLRAQAKKFSVEVFAMDSLPDVAALRLQGPIYISFDMDALDPAFAPGVSHWEPGGLTTREALRYILALPPPIIGADIVEFNPIRDPNGFTATVAAKILKEILGKMLAR